MPLNCSAQNIVDSKNKIVRINIYSLPQFATYFTTVDCGNIKTRNPQKRILKKHKSIKEFGYDIIYCGFMFFIGINASFEVST